MMGSEPQHSPVTAEIGSLNTKPNDESRFIGSSTGVFFVRTVRKAFSAASNVAHIEDESSPLDEQCVVGSDAGSETGSHPAVDEGVSAGELYLYGEDSLVRAIGATPDQKLASELVMTYFKTWHQIFPFLHGPSFSQDLEALYANPQRMYSAKRAPQYIIFQCIFNLASLDRPDLVFPPQCRIQSPKNVLHLLGFLVQRYDVHSIQALLACQVFLLANMALRPASTVGGLIVQSIFHAGLHRCPFRYEQISHQECDIRKRVFWTAYSIDRYLSQALGKPLGIQDSDVDVCLPGLEDSHHPVVHDRRTSRDPAAELQLHLPHQPEAGHRHNPAYMDSRPGGPAWIGAELKQRREAALANYAEYATLIGRALEIFHKSIVVRRADRNDVMLLHSDIDSWWNDLPSYLQDMSPESKDGGPDLSIFFNVLYHQLILQVNRPALSLDPSVPDFRSGLQTCIKAARSIISLLKEPSAASQTAFWPGFLSAAWMSGLVIAFACQLGWYSTSKGALEVDICVDILSSMTPRWHTAKHCRIALASLLDDIKSKPQVKTSRTRRESTLRFENQGEPLAKRQRLAGSNDTSGGLNGHGRLENSQSDLGQFHHQYASPPDDQQRNSDMQSVSGTSTTANQEEASMHVTQQTMNTVVRPSSIDSNASGVDMLPAPALDPYQRPVLSPEQMWSNGVPQDPNMGFLSQYMDNPYTGGFDFNTADVFEGATWENLMDLMGQDVR